MDYTFLQNYWWFLISLLGALLVFLMFVQGRQSLVYSVGKEDSEFKLLLGSLARKWEWTFTTLVTFGGAFFCLIPTVLLHKFRWSILGVDDNTFQFHCSGSLV